MRAIEGKEIKERIKALCLEANFFLRADVFAALREAQVQEENKLAKLALSEIVKNAQIAREQKKPICQDTGHVTIFLEVGNEVHIVTDDLKMEINQGVSEAYIEGNLRKSIVTDPLFSRKNTLNNTPPSIYFENVPGEKIKITVFPKGGGSDNASSLKMLKPSDGLDGFKKFVLEEVKKNAPFACPPLVVGIGVGGSFDSVGILAKKALLEPLGRVNQDKKLQRLEEEILKEINQLGIGPNALGGKVTALAVHIRCFPTHMASLPVALNLSCHALRSARTIL